MDNFKKSQVPHNNQTFDFVRFRHAVCQRAHGLAELGQAELGQGELGQVELLEQVAAFLGAG